MYGWISRSHGNIFQVWTWRCRSTFLLDRNDVKLWLLEYKLQYHVRKKMFTDVDFNKKNFQEIFIGTKQMLIILWNVMKFFLFIDIDYWSLKSLSLKIEDYSNGIQIQKLQSVCCCFYPFPWLPFKSHCHQGTLTAIRWLVTTLTR